MNRAFIVCLCLGLLGGVALAQQPNNTNATQMINGQNGPPFPITGVAVPLGVPSLGLLQGLPNANFVTFVSHTLAPGGWTVQPSPCQCLRPRIGYCLGLTDI